MEVAGVDRARDLQLQPESAAAESAAAVARLVDRLVESERRLAESSSEASRLRGDLAAALSESEGLARRAEEGARAGAEARGRAEAAERLRGEMEDRSAELGGRLGRAERERNEAIERCDRLREDMADLGAEAERLTSLAGEVETVRAERSELEAELNARRAANENLAAELSNVRATLGVLEREMAAANDNLREAADRQTHLEREADVLRVARDGVRQQADDLARQLESAAAESAAAVARLVDRLAESERRLAESSSEASRLRGDLAAALSESEGLARRAEEGARAGTEARGRAEAAERLADRLRGEMDRLGRDREAEIDGFGTSLRALQQDLDQSRACEKEERTRAVDLARALADLERRHDETVKAARRAPTTDEPAGARNPPGADDVSCPGGGGDGREDQVESLNRQLTELRRSNQRLCSLLEVFGLPKGLASGRPGSALTAGPDVSFSTRPADLPTG